MTVVPAMALAVAHMGAMRNSAFRGAMLQQSLLLPAGCCGHPSRRSTWKHRVLVLLAGVLCRLYGDRAASRQGQLVKGNRADSTWPSVRGEGGGGVVGGEEPAWGWQLPRRRLHREGVGEVVLVVGLLWVAAGLGG